MDVYIDMVFVGAEAKVFLVVEKVEKVQTFERYSKPSKRLEGSPRIFFRRPNEDVQVIRRTHVAVCNDRHAANDGVVNLCGEKRGED